MSSLPPFPPSPLRERVFAGGEPAESTTTYDAVGQGIADAIERCLPSDWTWDGRRVLDFACGAGRVLRHLAPAHPSADWWGCDVHSPSIDWLQNATAGSVHAFACDPEPPLALEDSHFDLVYGISAFTHLGWNWAGWIAEIHRILRPGGVLIASVLGRDLQKKMLGAELDDDGFGILVCGHGHPADENGPTVFHSQWWLRAHWGRAFEIVDYKPDDFVVGRMRDGAAHRQCMLVARARNVPVSMTALLAAEPNEPRETIGLTCALARTIQELDAVLDDVRKHVEAAEQRDRAQLASPIHRRLSRMKRRLRSVSAVERGLEVVRRRFRSP